MYTNFTAETLEVATELENAGFEIRVAASYVKFNRRLDWFQFRKGGNIGYYSGDHLADHHWSMPVKPSREFGSGMFVDAAEDAATATEAATIITQDYNHNPIVGTHANFADVHDLSGYVLV